MINPIFPVHSALLFTQPLGALCVLASITLVATAYFRFAHISAKEVSPAPVPPLVFRARFNLICLLAVCSFFNPAIALVWQAYAFYDAETYFRKMRQWLARSNALQYGHRTPDQVYAKLTDPSEYTYLQGPIAQLELGTALRSPALTLHTKALAPVLNSLTQKFSPDRVAVHVAANYEFHLGNSSGGQAKGVHQALTTAKQPARTDYTYLKAQYDHGVLGLSPRLLKICQNLPTEKPEGCSDITWDKFQTIQPYIDCYVKACSRYGNLNAAIQEMKKNPAYDNFYRAIVLLHELQAQEPFIATHLLNYTNYIELNAVLRQKRPEGPVLYHTAAPDFGQTRQKYDDWRLPPNQPTIAADNDFIFDSIYSATYKMLVDADKEGLEAIILTPTGTNIFLGYRTQLVENQYEQVAPHCLALVRAVQAFQKKNPNTQLQIHVTALGHAVQQQLRDLQCPFASTDQQ